MRFILGSHSLFNEFSNCPVQVASGLCPFATPIDSIECIYSSLSDATGATGTESAFCWLISGNVDICLRSFFIDPFVPFGVGSLLQSLAALHGLPSDPTSIPVWLLAGNHLERSWLAKGASFTRKHAKILLNTWPNIIWGWYTNRFTNQLLPSTLQMYASKAQDLAWKFGNLFCFSLRSWLLNYSTLN